MGKPNLDRSRNFLKLEDQRFIKHIQSLKGVEMNNMVIENVVDF